MKSAEDTDYSDVIGGTNKVRRRAPVIDLFSVARHDVYYAALSVIPHIAPEMERSLWTVQTPETGKAAGGPGPSPIRLAKTLPVCFECVNDGKFQVKEWS